MFNQPLYIVIVVLFYSVTNGRHHKHESSNKDWDVILFTQNWPVTECLQYKQDDPTGECNMVNSFHWTVHGAWPTKLGTKGPSNCNKQLKFDINQLKSIVDEMANRWLSIKSGNGEDKTFWQHEWEKHGTCATQISSLDSEIKYFSQGLRWNTQYNMSSLLNKAGMKPGGAPSNIDDIYNNLKSVLGKNPFISCFKQKKSEKIFLIDVRLCFDKSLSLVDCDGVKRSYGEHPLTQDCPSDSSIYYPDQTELNNYTDSDNYLKE